MALYIPHSIFHLARLLYVRPETFGPCYVSQTMNSVQHNMEKNVIAYHHPTSLYEYVAPFYYSDPYSVCGTSAVR